MTDSVIENKPVCLFCPASCRPVRPERRKPDPTSQYLYVCVCVCVCAARKHSDMIECQVIEARAHTHTHTKKIVHAGDCIQ